MVPRGDGSKASTRENGRQALVLRFSQSRSPIKKLQSSVSGFSIRLLICAKRTGRLGTWRSFWRSHSGGFLWYRLGACLLTHAATSGPNAQRRPGAARQQGSNLDQLSELVPRPLLGVEGLCLAKGQCGYRAGCGFDGQRDFASARTELHEVPEYRPIDV
ncbi:hypothetical protein B0J11DRAFT_507286 [Dendryphion nanum]|uniref:Uncharacterized protein n=1 Tax=Dendryphion nanum TaxID=256645 RepID=A0A9P9DNB1_9PLEO|nr:hypothetical protein B0J11DRAFT_507286 [Dendryphion nanum]